VVTESRSRRAAPLTALYLGFFAAIWFSWPGVNPPLGTVLVVASYLSLLVALIGAIVAFRRSGETASVRDRAASRRYGIIVAIEFAAAGVGAAVLGLTGAGEYISVWVCLVVGAHFFPLVPVLRDRLLYPLGAALCAVAVGGLVAALATDVAADAVVGTGAGFLLFGYAALSLLAARPFGRS